MKGFIKKYKSYIVSIPVALAMCILGAIATRAGKEQYDALVKPPLTPPGWVFGVVWTILYILMGISAARIYDSGAKLRGDALFVYGVQLVVNVLWTLFYFTFGARLLAFFWLIFLFILVMLMINRFKKIDTTAAKLQYPYAVWLIFASYLNLATYLING